MPTDLCPRPIWGGRSDEIPKYPNTQRNSKPETAKREFGRLAFRAWGLPFLGSARRAGAAVHGYFVIGYLANVKIWVCEDDWVTLMLNARFFNLWALAVLVIGVVRFLQAWLRHWNLTAATVQLVAGALIASFLWLVGRSLGRPEFRRAPLKVWIVGLGIFAVAFALTVIVIQLIF